MHVHEREDEWFYVLDGQVDFILDDDVFGRYQGGSVFLPRGMPHTFRVKSAEARLLSLYTPGGFEEYFRESGGTRCRLAGAVRLQVRPINDILKGCGSSGSS